MNVRAASPSVRVMGLAIADLTEDGVVSTLTDLAINPGGRARGAFALHIGGLLELNDADYVLAMASSSLNYADGMSAVLLARAAGAKNIERSVTTDVGWKVLRGFNSVTGRPCRFALVGGASGLAMSASEVLEADGAGIGVYATHGYHDDWKPVLHALRVARPDVIFVGLGAPFEMKWVHHHMNSLPTAAVLTCGGWFGYLIGDESRAPRFMRRYGLEWLYRLGQQPRRLLGRYLRGALHLPRFLTITLWARRGTSLRRVGRRGDRNR